MAAMVGDMAQNYSNHVKERRGEERSEEEKRREKENNRRSQRKIRNIKKHKRL